MPPLNVKNKTCLFCLKQRPILVNDTNTAKAIQEIYDIELPTDECRICIECHFNISRVREFKRTIEAATDLDVDSCFVCKSENTISEPGVDRVVDYLIKQCSTIDFGLTDTVKACVTCMYVLETSIKYEKLANNYASARRFCKQYSTLRECNIALWKIDLDDLASVCDDGGGGRGRGGSGKGKKGRKRGPGPWGKEETPSKKLKKEDGSVLPVMLTKMTPTSTPTGKPGKKSLSPPGSQKGKGMKQNDKIFIKLPLPSKLQKKKAQKYGPRKKYGPPHSPSKPIPTEPSVDDLNKIFNVELRQLSIRIEHVDLSNYLSKTIATIGKSRQVRKPKKEEFIGLDEEDVVELQNTSVCSVGKRKSILITERIESPNSAKKKVKFSDSPSIKYVDKVNFSDDENGKDDSDDEKDADYGEKKSKKKQNGPSENGKPRKGRPRKVQKEENGEPEGDADKDEKEAEDSKETSEAKKEGEAEESLTQKEAEKDEQATEDETRSETEKATDTVVENGQGEETPDTEAETGKETPEVSRETSETVESDKEAPSAEEAVAPMEAEDAEPSGTVEPMKTDQIEDTTDAEMKDVNSPEDVEMTESSPTQDVEMKEAVEHESKPEDRPSDEALESVEKVSEPEPAEAPADIAEEQSAAEFELSDKEEEEIEQVKQTVNDLLGEAISDSDQQESQHSQENEDETSKSEEPEEKSYSEPAQESAPASENEPAEPASQPDVPPAESNTVSEKVPETESPAKKNQSFSSLDDVDDISDDDDILNQLDDERSGRERKRSPDLPPLGEDSL